MVCCRHLKLFFGLGFPIARRLRSLRLGREDIGSGVWRDVVYLWSGGRPHSLWDPTSPWDYLCSALRMTGKVEHRI